MEVARAAQEHHVKYVMIRKDLRAYELVRGYLDEFGFSPVVEDPWFSLFQYRDTEPEDQAS